MRTRLCTLALLAVLTGSAYASGVPDLDQSYWTCRTDQDVVVVVCPAGDGMTLDAAWPAAGGDPVDATIDAWIIDGGGNPVFMYPFEDIWLDGPNVSACPAGSIAESSTDIDGHTTFNTLFIGGHAIGDVAVFVSGDAITGSAPNLSLVSPDLDGDLAIGLVDIVLFTQAFFGSYDPAADFDGNGDIDLTDLVLFMRHDGHTCP